MTEEQQIKKMACDMCTVSHVCSAPYAPIKVCDALKCAKKAFRMGCRKVVFCKDCRYLTVEGLCFKSQAGVTPAKPDPNHFCAYGSIDGDNE